MTDTNDNDFIIEGGDDDFETNMDDLIASQSDLSKNVPVKKNESDTRQPFDSADHYKIKEKEKEKKSK